MPRYLQSYCTCECEWRRADVSERGSKYASAACARLAARCSATRAAQQTPLQQAAQQRRGAVAKATRAVRSAPSLTGFPVPTVTSATRSPSCVAPRHSNGWEGSGESGSA